MPPRATCREQKLELSLVREELESTQRKSVCYKRRLQARPPALVWGKDPVFPTGTCSSAWVPSFQLYKA